MTSNRTAGPLKLSRRGFLRIAAGAALGVFVPGCGRTEPSAPSPVLDTGLVDTRRYAKAPPWRIGRAGRGDLSSWHLMLSAHIDYGIKDKYRDLFDAYLCTSANWDAEKQTQDLQFLLTQDLDLLLIDAMDGASVTDGVHRAVDQGLPVILVSAGVAGVPSVSWVTMAEEQRGELCADWLCRTMSGGGKVIALQSVPAAGAEGPWLQGVRRRLDSEPEVRQLRVATAFWSPAAARDTMVAIVEEFGAPDGVIIQSGSVGQGVVEALAQGGQAIPPIAGGDDSNGWLRVAKESQVRFLGLGGGANLGLRCVELAVDVLSGRPVPAYVQFPFEVFDQSALDRYYRPELSDYYWAINDLPAAWIERMFRV